MPADPSLLQRALAAHQAGRAAEAQKYYDAVLQAEPRNADALYLCGCLALDTNRVEPAIVMLERSLAARPGQAAVHNALGNAQSRRKDWERAEESYRRAVRCEPPSLPAFANLGATLRARGRVDEAIAVYREALSLKPEFPEVLMNLGLALMTRRETDEAIAAYLRALDCRPDLAEAHNNLAIAYRTANRLAEAEAACRAALSLRPDYAEAWSNLAAILYSQQRLEPAVEAGRQARALKPAYAEARLNTGLALLLAGRLREGWSEYEFRWDSVQKNAQRRFHAARWRGEAEIAGKTILLHAEQGLGDTLQFLRYAPLVAARGARVLLEVQPALKPLLATLPGIAGVFAEGERLPDFDWHCPLLSLPLVFDTEVATIPPPGPLGPLPAGKIAKWSGRLGGQAGPRVGLVWFGNRKHTNDHNRSIPAADLAAFLQTSRRPFFSLQKGLREAADVALAGRPPLADLAPEIQDFGDTAAILQQLDLLVTVDTSVAHLAGLLGRPVWVLLPWTPDWRWLLGRDDSPWYPTARLFRQPRVGDWAAVLQEVRRRLDTEFPV